MEKNTVKNDRIILTVGFFVYFGISALAGVLSDAVGVENLFNAIFVAVLAVAAVIILKKLGLLSYYGLGDFRKLNAKNLLYFVPFALIPFAELIFGVEVSDTPLGIIPTAFLMLGVGFFEELIFRGFLIRTLEHINVKLAVIFSGVFFGALHLVNIMSGAEVVPTLFQVLYAAAFGLMCSLFFYKTRNIIPCILCHALTNVLDIFAPQTPSVLERCVSCGVIIILCAFYTVYLFITKKQLTN